MKSKIKKADTLWSKLIRTMYPRCVFGPSGCGYFAERPGDEAHHIIPRRFKAARWHYANGIRVCPHHHDWIHAHPQQAGAEIKKKLPKDALKLLEAINRHEVQVLSESVVDAHIDCLQRWITGVTRRSSNQSKPGQTQSLFDLQ